MTKSEAIKAQRNCYATLIILLMSDEDLDVKFKNKMANVITAFIVTFTAFVGDATDKEIVKAIENLCQGEKALDEIKEFLNNHKN